MSAQTEPLATASSPRPGNPPAPHPPHDSLAGSRTKRPDGLPGARIPDTFLLDATDESNASFYLRGLCSLFGQFSPDGAAGPRQTK